jgi:hypothetical protein
MAPQQLLETQSQQGFQAYGMQFAFSPVQQLPCGAKR